MPVPPTLNPNAVLPPATVFPPPDAYFALKKLLGQQHDRAVAEPRSGIGGLLDLIPYRTLPGENARPLGQNVAEVIDARRRFGLLGGQSTEGARPYLGGGGGRSGGLLGSQWRDPAFVEQYAKSQGIEPGHLQPVEPQDTVVKMPARAQGEPPPSQKQIEQFNRNRASALQTATTPNLDANGKLHPTVGYAAAQAKQKIPDSLVTKIIGWGNKVGASPEVTANALNDASSIKSARKAWESYDWDSFLNGIMPPAMQTPQPKK